MNAGARLARLEAAAAVNLARKKKAAPIIYRAVYGDDETDDNEDAGAVFIADYTGGGR